MLPNPSIPLIYKQGFVTYTIPRKRSYLANAAFPFHFSLQALSYLSFILLFFLHWICLETAIQYKCTCRDQQ